MKGLLLLIILFTFFRKDLKKMGNLPRGIRNNNPLNIEKNSIKWQGAIIGNDERFITFEEPEYGIRAGAKILKNYQKLYNLFTVEKIINRYAPPIENDSNSYAEHIANALNINKNEYIILDDDKLFIMLKAMIKHENGINIYTDEQIKKGVEMA